MQHTVSKLHARLRKLLTVPHQLFYILLKVWTLPQMSSSSWTENQQCQREKCTHARLKVKTSKIQKTFRDLSAHSSIQFATEPLQNQRLFSKHFSGSLLHFDLSSNKSFAKLLGPILHLTSLQTRCMIVSTRASVAGRSYTIAVKF